MTDFIVFIDNKRIWKFRIGDNIRLGQEYYHIRNLEPLEHKSTCDAVAAGGTGSKTFDTYMRPMEEYLYFVESQGIDGLCEFRFQFPQGQPHFAPQSSIEYIDWMRASKLKPKYMPYFIKHGGGEYTAVELSNPSGVSNVSDIYFYGWKFHVTKLTEIPIKFIEVTDYPRSGQMGVA